MSHRLRSRTMNMLGIKIQVFFRFTYVKFLTTVLLLANHILLDPSLKRTKNPLFKFFGGIVKADVVVIIFNLNCTLYLIHQFRTILFVGDA